MNIDETMKQIINDSPALPDDLYPEIETHIHTHRWKKRTIIALAASLLLTIGVVSTMYFKQDTHRTVALTSPKVATELEDIHEYLNSDDLEEYAALYTYIENY